MDEVGDSFHGMGLSIDDFCIDCFDFANLWRDTRGVAFGLDGRKLLSSIQRLTLIYGQALLPSPFLGDRIEVLAEGRCRYPRVLGH